MKYAYLILIVILFIGCVGSGSDDTNVANVTNITNESTAPPVLTEEELANKTFNYIKEAFLEPRGLDGKLESIESFGEGLYIVNFTFGKGMTQTQTQAYVTSGGKLILGPQVAIVDITKPPETQRPMHTPRPSESKRIDVSIDGDKCLGSQDAPVTIIEFSDYQCPYCQRFWAQTMPQLKKAYIDTGKVKFVYRDFPISSLGHAYTQKAAEATGCAGEQGKFWEFHDKLFENQNRLTSSQKQVDGPTIEGRTIVTIKSERGTFYFDITDDIKKMQEFSQELGMDTTAFNSCLDSGKYTKEVQKDLQDGVNAGVTGTPAFFINGIFVNGAQPFESFKQIIDGELADNASASAKSTISGTCG